MKQTIEKIRKFDLSQVLDHFIPLEIQVQPEAHRRARMFMLSHVFGPILSTPLPLYMVVMNIARDYRVVVFFLSILLFWAYPFALKRTGRYQLLSFLSVQNLIFCVLWACYAFGGMRSPFLSWILIFPLLAFLYLPPRGWIRNVLLAQIFGNLALFVGLYATGYTFPFVDLRSMQTIGLISTGAVATYFAMMSLYFARMLREQREFTREINSLISTSDNLRNLTQAANQASAAKANFVASMSHELRTPLNAIIGYSQMLLEEAHEEEDEMMASDLGHIHKSGSDLLRLIDDILDYSRIDAGKMPLNPTFGSCGKYVDAWKERIAPLIREPRRIEFAECGEDSDFSLVTDWTALSATVQHLVAGIADHHGDGCIRIAFAPVGADHKLVIRFQDISPDGTIRMTNISQEMFEHEQDASSSKYGGTGIEIALSFKFVHLLGGELRTIALADGASVTELIVPDLSPEQQMVA